MANTYLSYTIASDGNKKLYTWSAWVKFSDGNTNSDVFHAGTDGNHNSFIRRISTGQLDIGTYNGYSGGWQYRLLTNRLFRDTNAWYHIVVRQDTDNGTADDRVRLYVNGVQETSFATRTNPSSGYEGQINNNLIHTLGRGIESGTSSNYRYHNGVISHVHFCDGYSYAPTEFGETDSTTGEWKIKTSPSVSYGTNGFFWLKDSIATTDHSPNSNTFTVGGGTLTKSEDNPSNVFATWNPLSKHPSCGHTYAHGNTKITMTTSRGSTAGTLGIPNDNGKFYWEMKCTTMPQDERFELGIQPFSNVEANDSTNANNKGLGLSLFNSVVMYAGSILNNFYGNNTTRFDGFTGIIGCAVDMTSATKTIAFSKDGAWISGSGTTDASFSNALKVDITSSVDDYSHWMPMAGSGNGSGTGGVLNTNFGNGYFGTTQVSSAGTNASGNGIFEYDVPTGYTALSTKGLNL